MKSKKVTVGIIGAGFTGLAAAYRLSKLGFKVTVFEVSDVPGGLAIGFENKKWKWPLESHYHHLFQTDHSIQQLANEVGHKIIFERPKTSTYFKGTISQIDSPGALLKFEHLNILDRLRTGIVIFYFKLLPFWRTLENITVEEFLPKAMGANSWKVLWRPLMQKKFGRFSKKIPASWFWARVKSRSASLGYPTGGFKSLANKIAKAAEKNKAEFLFSHPVDEIKEERGSLVLTSRGHQYIFDKVICTLPTHLFIKITKSLPKEYLEKMKSLEGLGAINLVLSLKKPFLKDGTYWLNVNESSFPFLCVVEHTNFMDSSIYNGQRIVYVGNYVERGNKYFDYNENELINEYIPYLKKINPHFEKSWILDSWVFKAPFAQPVISKNYSKHVLPLRTPIEGLYLANIQQVYPWDRGTNYAVELGEKVSKLISK